MMILILILILILIRCSDNYSTIPLFRLFQYPICTSRIPVGAFTLMTTAGNVLRKLANPIQTTYAWSCWFYHQILQGLVQKQCQIVLASEAVVVCII